MSHVMLGMPRPPTSRTVGPSPDRRAASSTPGSAMTMSKPSFGVVPAVSLTSATVATGAAAVAPVALGAGMVFR